MEGRRIPTDEHAGLHEADHLQHLLQMQVLHVSSMRKRRRLGDGG